MKLVRLCIAMLSLPAAAGNEASVMIVAKMDASFISMTNNSNKVEL